MAKWGEGDPRWIVEERPDATNVNNWHWTEKNATPWSKDRLKILFQDFKIAENDIEVTITDISKIDGEATANNRKGKLIFFYEWNIVFKWSGRLPDSDEAQEGKATIPNLSEENSLDEVEITITIDKSNRESDRLKEFMYNVGREKIRKQLGVYLKELKEEYSKGLLLPRKEDGQKPVKPDSVTVISSGFNKKSPDTNETKITTPTANVGVKIDVKTLKSTNVFQCRAEELYDALTKPEMVSAFTRSAAKVEPIKGGEFFLFGGNIQGKFEVLERPNTITQTWRLKQWPAGHYSQVVMKLNEKPGHTELRLTQTGVPASEADSTRTNWERYYWNAIKQAFGFGSFLV